MEIACQHSSSCLQHRTVHWKSKRTVWFSLFHSFTLNSCYFFSYASTFGSISFQLLIRKYFRWFFSMQIHVGLSIFSRQIGICSTIFSLNHRQKNSHLTQLYVTWCLCLYSKSWCQCAIWLNIWNERNTFETMNFETQLKQQTNPMEIDWN